MARKAFIMLGAGVVVLAVASGPIATDRVTAFSEALNTPIMVDCELQCWDGPNFGCDVGKHYAFDSGSFRNAMRRNGAHTDGQCKAGSCADQHDEGQCDEVVIEGHQPLTTADTEALRVALRDEDAFAAREIILAHPTEVKVNMARSAVQIVACSGMVKAHLPIRSRFAAGLSSSVSH